MVGGSGIIVFFYLFFIYQEPSENEVTKKILSRLSDMMLIVLYLGNLIAKIDIMYNYNLFLWEQKFGFARIPLEAMKQIA